MEPVSVSPRYKNRVLAMLPAAEIKRLEAHLSPVKLKLHHTLHDAGQKVDSAYFLEEGICSVVVTMKTGTTVEVGIIGRDGVVGLPALLGSGQSPNRAYMQIAGHGYRIKAKVLRDLSDESSDLRLSLFRAVQAMFAQTAQTAACNRVHELEERLGRWLLMCHDRVGDDKIPITHEFLAMMLGTRRTTVTVAAGMLQKAGLITYSRGQVTIKDRKGLEGAACECYKIIREEYARLGLL